MKILAGIYISLVPSSLPEIIPKPSPIPKKIDIIPIFIKTEFKEKFKLSPVKRSKLKGLKRNAEFLIKK